MSDFIFEAGGRLGVLGCCRDRRRPWRLGLTWADLVALEPMLAGSLEYARLGGRHRQLAIKGLAGLVGWDGRNALHPILGTQEAYDVALDVLDGWQERPSREPSRRR